jgi:hypothetical protein
VQHSFHSTNARSGSTAERVSTGIVAAEHDCHSSIDSNIVVGLRRPDAIEENDFLTTLGRIRWRLSLGSHDYLNAQLLMSRKLARNAEGSSRLPQSTGSDRS